MGGGNSRYVDSGNGDDGNNAEDSGNNVEDSGGTSETTYTPLPQPQPQSVSPSVSSNTAASIGDSLKELTDSKWKDIMDQIESYSQRYTHECGTVLGDATKSKDTDAVNNLNGLKNQAIDLQNDLLRFLKDIYTNPGNNSYNERMRVLNTINYPTGQFRDLTGSKQFLNGDQCAAKNGIEYTRKNTIAANQAAEVSRGQAETQRTTDLENSQATLKTEFESKNATLDARINDLNNKIQDAEKVRGDRDVKKSKLVGPKSKADNQYNISGSVQTSLASAAALNSQHLNYLIDREKKTQGLAVDSYEELYKTVILQNDLLEIAKTDIEKNTITTQRKTTFLTDKKTLVHGIYIRLYVIYYILIVIFIGLLVFYKKPWSIYYKIALIITGLIYPLVILTLESWIYNCWLYVMSLLTGSVYVYRSL